MTRRQTILLSVLAMAAVAGCAHTGKGVAGHEARLALQEDAQASLDERVAAMETRMANVDGASAKDLRRMGRELERAREQARELEERVGELERSLEAIRSRTAAELRIKTLGADGRMDAARALAERINSLGYTVESVGLAPGDKHFERVTVFYQEAYRPEAVRLAIALGGDTLLKPLTWQSVFHVVVVAPPE
jgi:hypothetical protein